MAQSAAKLFGNSKSPLGQSPFAQRISAGYELMYRLGKDYEKPEFGLRTIYANDIDIAIHERVEINKPFCELRRFKRFTDDVAELALTKFGNRQGQFSRLFRDADVDVFWVVVRLHDAMLHRYTLPSKHSV